MMAASIKFQNMSRVRTRNAKMLAIALVAGMISYSPTSIARAQKPASLAQAAPTKRFLAMVVSKSAESLQVMNCFSGKRVSVRLVEKSEIVANGKPAIDLHSLRAGDFAVIGDYAQGNLLIARYVISDEQRSAAFRERLGKTLAIGTVVAMDKDGHRFTLRQINGEVMQLELSDVARAQPEAIAIVQKLQAGDRLMARGSVRQRVFHVEGIQRLSEDQSSLVGVL